MTSKSASLDSAAEAPTLRLRLLGRFEVALGEHAVAENQWRLRKSKSLIKLLALAPQHRLHRDQLMDVLWGNLAPLEASHNLHQALYVARRALGATNKASVFLQLQDEVLRLGPEQLLQIDVDAFERAVQQARSARTPSAYNAAIDLYAGDLLPDDRYEEWVTLRRDRLTQEYQTLLSELAALYESQREHSAAIDTTKRLLSADPANEEAHRRLMRNYALSNQRQHALRQYDVLRESLRRDLDAEPDRESKRLYDQILAGQFLSGEVERTADRSPERNTSETHNNGFISNNLPLQLTSFIGRERELGELAHLLATARLLTLTGAGGTGKTRLALQLAAAVLDRYKDGIWFVEFAPLSDPALVVQTIANVLGVHEASSRPLQIILNDWLRPKQILLILDNCEHLIDACASFADGVLRACRDTQILATSREALGIAGETTYRVPSLELPNPKNQIPVAALSEYEAIRLFVERSGATQSGFVLNDTNAAAVMQICYRLDGIPLAIELAAARVRGLSVEQIAARLDDSFQLLTGGSRTALRRHQTLRALIDWSYDLLSEPEQKLLQRLSVFAGGWTLEAAESVGAGDGIEQHEVLDLLLRLQDKSLITRIEGEHHIRYRMLETVRQYALDKLNASGQTNVVRDQHLAWFTQLAESLEPKLRGTQRAAALASLEEDFDNIRLALGWGIEKQPELATRLQGVLYDFWSTQGHLQEGYTVAQRVLATFQNAPGMTEQFASDPAHPTVGNPARARAEAKVFMMVQSWEFVQGNYDLAQTYLNAAEKRARLAADQTLLQDVFVDQGMIQNYLGNLKEARALLEQGVNPPRLAGDIWGRAYSIWMLGDVVAKEDPDRAQTMYEESLSLFRQAGEQYFASFPMVSLAHLMAEQGDYANGRALLEESLAIRRKRADKYILTINLNSLAEVMCYQADFASAAPLCHEALDLCESISNKSGIAWSLRNLAVVAEGQGDIQRAQSLFRDSLMRNRDLGQKLDIAYVLEALANVALIQEQPEQTPVLLGAADELWQSVNAVRYPRQWREKEKIVALARDLLGDVAYDTGYAEGRALSIEKAIDLAIGRAGN